MHYYRACTATHWFLESHTYWTHRLSAPVQLMLNGNMPCNIQMAGFGINDMKNMDPAFYQRFRLLLVV